MREVFQKLGFIHEFEVIDLATGRALEREVQRNRIPQAGINFLMLAPFGDANTQSAFHCGLFLNNFIPVSGSLATDIPSVMGEWTNYSESTRPEWVRAYDGVGDLNNDDNPAIFTPTADAVVYGSFLVSSPIKGGDAGLLLSVARFSTAKSLSTGQQARLRCGIEYVPSTSV